eukprot:3798155-Prymnesium_polylepis.2
MRRRATAARRSAGHHTARLAPKEPRRHNPRGLVVVPALVVAAVEVVVAHVRFDADRRRGGVD